MVSVARAAATTRAPSAARAAPRHVAAPPARDAAEREAEQAAAPAARGLPPMGWSFASVPVSPPPEADTEPDARVADAVAGPGRPLEAAMRHAMEARFGVDLSGVRLHDDAATVAATRAAGAEGLAVGDDVALAERLDPASPWSRALLAHELAHVVQQRAAGAVAAVQRKDGAAAAPSTTLAGLPDADRQRIQLVTMKVTIPELAEKFATTGTKTTIPLPSGLTAAFDASVDLSLQPGLSNVVGSLTTTVELTEVALVPNSTITLELDLGGKVGKGLYRFTHHAPPAAPGAKGAAKPAPRVLVEALGKATAPPGTKAPPTPAKPGGPAAPDPVADKIKNHSLSVPYKDAELDALRAALGQIPDAQLAAVDGLKFSRDAASPDDPKADGDYDYKTHMVTMYDKAFTASQTRVKGPGTVASDSATRAIVHEIGHAIDLAAIRKAHVDQKTADAAVATLYGKYANPKAPKKLKYPTGGPEEEEVKTVLKAQADADAKVLAARALSGTKTVKKPGKADFEDVIGTDVKGIKFREAAKKDGGKAVSAYGEKDFQEAFAEAYSLYITAPDTLKALRPNVFEYLDQDLPK